LFCCHSPSFKYRAVCQVNFIVTPEDTSRISFDFLVV
jgi:hypothetical protein